MGLFDFFRRRRERESAVAGLSVSADPPRQVSAMSAGDQVAPHQGSVDGGLDLTQLTQIGTLIAQAAKEGSIQVHQGDPQEIDLRGTGIREEILGIMSRHGIDAEGVTPHQIDASQISGMQQEILEALGRQGVDLDAFGGGAGEIQIEQPGSDDQA